MTKQVLCTVDADKTTIEIKEGGGDGCLSANAVFTGNTKVVKVGNNITLLYRECMNGVFGRKGLWLNTGYATGDGTWYLDRPDAGDVSFADDNSDKITVKDNGTKVEAAIYGFSSAIEERGAPSNAAWLTFYKNEISPEIKHDIGFSDSDTIYLTVNTGGENVEAKSAEVTLTTQGFTITSGELADGMKATSFVEGTTIRFRVTPSDNFLENISIVTKNAGDGMILSGLETEDAARFTPTLELTNEGVNVNVVLKHTTTNNVFDHWKNTKALRLELVQKELDDNNADLNKEVSVTFEIKEDSVSIVDGSLLEHVNYKWDNSNANHVLRLDYGRTLAELRDPGSTGTAYIQLEAIDVIGEGALTDSVTPRTITYGK